MLAQLAPALDAVRLSLHVLAAAVWVGGQMTLAGLVPTARRLGGGALAARGAVTGVASVTALVLGVLLAG